MPVKNARPMQTYSADAYALSSTPPEDLAHGELPLHYDYSQVAEEHRAAVMTSARTIKRHEQRTVESMVVIGRELTAVQEKLPHGQFLPWLEQEFGWQRSTAYNLLQLAAKFPTVGNLPTGIGLSALYQLTAAPDSALEEAKARQQTGEKITKRVATAIATRHRQAQLRNAPPSPPQALTGVEAIALIWRDLKQHHQASNADELTRHQQRLTWLQTAPLLLFTEMIQPGVGYTEALLLTAIEAVKTEIQGTIDHLLRTPPCVGELTSSATKTAQVERLPAYLTAAGATLTRLLDGALAAQFDAEQRLFAGNQTQQAISWLDTLVRAANNQQGARHNRLALLLHRTLPDLREALTLAADTSKLQEAIKLIEEIIATNQEP